MRIDEETLTAYALGELEQARTLEVERALREDTEAQRALAELRALAQLAEEALVEEPELRPAQRAAIAAAAREAQRPRRRWRWIWAPALAAAAAGLAAIVIVPSFLMMGGETQYGPEAGSGAKVVAEPASETDNYREHLLKHIEHHLEADGEVPPPERPERLRSLGYVDGDGGRGDADRLQDANALHANLEILDAKSRDRGKKLDFTGSGDEGGEGRERWRERRRGWNQAEAQGSESYDPITDNSFLDALEQPLSTFSIDVDTASYANMRRYLTQGSLPPTDAVRIEELLNYFDYDYPQPVGERPFSATVEVAGCPWAPDHRLVRLGLKGKELQGELPPANLVFLLDVSGSMSSQDKLPLLKRALKLLVAQLRPEDRVAIVVYAGSSGLVLPSTAGDERQAILGALRRLESGGSTNGGAGIQLAYDVARANFVLGGANRVILATDGDFNVGTTSRAALLELIRREAASGVFLTVLGFGTGNLKDGTLEQLADKGNGLYGYVDGLPEARKLLVQQLGGSLVTIAKDVKIQVEFNPAEVSAYRLLGYENRVLAARDFDDDRKDAGEIGAGHTVTALYEIVPAGRAGSGTDAGSLRYQRPRVTEQAAASGELLTLKLRYKRPQGSVSQLLEFPLRDRGASYAQASADFKFAAAVAGFGMLLRDSPHRGHANYAQVAELAQEGASYDPHGYRAQFLELVALARGLAGE